MSEQVFLYLIVLVLCAGALFRFRRLLVRPRDGAERAQFGMYALSAVGWAVQIPPIYAALDRLVGIPNVAVLISIILILIAAWCVQVFYLFVTHTDAALAREIRRRAWLLVGVCILTTALFWLADVREEVPDLPTFKARYALGPCVLAANVLICAWTSMAFWSMAQLSWYYARLSHRPMSRLGLTIAAAGALLGIVSSVHTELDFGTRIVGLSYPLDPPDAVSNALIASAVFLLLVGNTMSLWGPRLRVPAALEWLGRYRAYAAIYPLWRDLCRAVPQVALERPARHAVLDLLPRRDMGFRLYRRLVEILDARLARRPYSDLNTASALAADACRRDPGCTELAVVLEAIVLDRAMQARTALRPVASRGALPPIPAGDRHQELAFFSRVACHRARGPLRVLLTVLAPRPDPDDRGLPVCHLGEPQQAQT